MIACLFPDCDYVTGGDVGDDERQKRIVVDHINNDHVDAHVIMACAHDWQHPEPQTLHTLDGTTGEPVEVHVVREQCTRCLQYLQRNETMAELQTRESGGLVVNL